MLGGEDLAAAQARDDALAIAGQGQRRALVDGDLAAGDLLAGGEERQLRAVVTPRGVQAQAGIDALRVGLGHQVEGLPARHRREGEADLDIAPERVALPEEAILGGVGAPGAGRAGPAVKVHQAGVGGRLHVEAIAGRPPHAPALEHDVIEAGRDALGTEDQAAAAEGGVGGLNDLAPVDPDGQLRARALHRELVPLAVGQAAAGGGQGVELAAAEPAQLEATGPPAPDDRAQEVHVVVALGVPAEADVARRAVGLDGDGRVVVAPAGFALARLGQAAGRVDLVGKGVRAELGVGLGDGLPVGAAGLPAALVLVGAHEIVGEVGRLDGLQRGRFVEAAGA